MSSSESGVSHHATLLELNRENSDALMCVMVKYAEMETLLMEAGHDTGALRDAIRSSLQSTVVLISVGGHCLMQDDKRER